MGPTCDTLPAPSVKTMSPERAIEATAATTSAKEGAYVTSFFPAATMQEARTAISMIDTAPRRFRAQVRRGDRPGRAQPQHGVGDALEQPHPAPEQRRQDLVRRCLGDEDQALLRQAVVGARRGRVAEASLRVARQIARFEEAEPLAEVRLFRRRPSSARVA